MGHTQTAAPNLDVNASRMTHPNFLKQRGEQTPPQRATNLARFVTGASSLVAFALKAKQTSMQNCIEAQGAALGPRMSLVPQHLLECWFVSKQHTDLAVDRHALVAAMELHRDASHSHIMPLWLEEAAQNYVRQLNGAPIELAHFGGPQDAWHQP